MASRDLVMVVSYNPRPAIRLPFAAKYDWPTVLIYLLAAIFASAIALFVVSRKKKMGHFRAVVASVFPGSTIGGMHCIGRVAKRLPTTCHFSKPTFAASAVLVIMISFFALLRAFGFRGDSVREESERFSTPSRWGRQTA